MCDKDYVIGEPNQTKPNIKQSGNTINTEMLVNFHCCTSATKGKKGNGLVTSKNDLVQLFNRNRKVP